MKSGRKKWRVGQGKFVVEGEELEGGVGRQLKERMRLSMTEGVVELFEEEKSELCGEPWACKGKGQARSGGTERGTIYLEGRGVLVRYARVAQEGRSRALPSYKALGNFDPLAEDVQAKLLRGVSTLIGRLWVGSLRRQSGRWGGMRSRRSSWAGS